ncbi:MAG TPA: YlxR family protein [Dehalococcoidia bacterium]|nr:YlxR family protein [Dehalococcoidia bacterium]
MSTSARVISKTKPRHIPQRTCVACRRTTAKRELVRVVRTAEGGAEVDPTGKRSGRGAYLCPTPDCWRLAVQKGRLDRALKTSVSARDKEALLQYAQALEPEAEV